jgi:hypothetical protein
LALGAAFNEPLKIDRMDPPETAPRLEGPELTCPNPADDRLPRDFDKVGNVFHRQEIAHFILCRNNVKSYHFKSNRIILKKACQAPFFGEGIRAILPRDETGIPE